MGTAPGGPGASAPPASGRARRIRRRVTIGVAASLVLCAVVLGLLRSPLFGADRLVVEGARRLSVERVLRIAGIGQGDNVVWFDADDAARRLEADPWISRAEVRADLPNTIHVRVTERAPVAAVETHDGWQVLAADGVLLATPADEPRLPTITVLVPGEDMATMGARLLGAMEADLRRRVGGLTVGVDGIVRLVLRTGVTVTYGDVGSAQEKAQALAAVIAWAQEERAHVQEIDVSVPGAPTARLAGGVVATP